MKHAMQPAVLDVSVSFNVPLEVDVIQVPTSLPPLYDGNKLLVYGLLRPKSKRFTLEEISGHAVLRGSILGKDIEHQIPFSASLSPLSQEEVFPAHRLAAKTLIKEMEEGNKPTQRIVDLSMEASVISRETAFMAVEEGSEQVIGAMKTYDLLMMSARGLDYEADVMMQKAVFYSKSSFTKKSAGGFLSSLGSSVSSAASAVSGWLSRGKKAVSVTSSQVVSDSCENEDIEEYIESAGAEDDDESEDDELEDYSATLEHESLDLTMTKPAHVPGLTPSLHPAQPSVVVALQQANGSWLLSDDLLMVLGLDRGSVEAACPLACEILVWATVLALTLLKVRYGEEQEELELVTNKARSWLGNQPLPSEMTLENLYAAAENLLT